MRVLVTGAGRGGTNWVTELVRASGQFNFTKFIEDHSFISQTTPPAGYGTKMATEFKGFSYEMLIQKLDQFPDLLVIFALRHPYDLAMSKVYRGRLRSEGGDTEVDSSEPADTPATAVAAIKYMASIYQQVSQEYGDRVLAVKLEDLILRISKVIIDVCRFLRIDATPEMWEAQAYVRNRYHQQRYGSKVDAGQVGLWDRWATVYEGYFAEQNTEREFIRESLKDEVAALGYKGEQ